MAAFEKDLCRKKSAPGLHCRNFKHFRRAVANHRSEFAIVKSKGQAKMSTLISPDVSVCDDCLGEMLAPDDRRLSTIRLSIAQTADPVTPLLMTSPMIGPKLPCGISRCVLQLSGRIRRPDQPPLSRPTKCLCGLRTACRPVYDNRRKRHHPAPAGRKKSSRPVAKRGIFWRSKAWADTIWQSDAVNTEAVQALAAPQAARGKTFCDHVL